MDKIMNEETMVKAYADYIKNLHGADTKRFPFCEESQTLGEAIDSIYREWKSGNLSTSKAMLCLAENDRDMTGYVEEKNMSGTRERTNLKVRAKYELNWLDVVHDFEEWEDYQTNGWTKEDIDLFVKEWGDDILEQFEEI